MVESITEILKELNQDNLENLSNEEVERLTVAILDELQFTTESVHNDCIVTKEKAQLQDEILKELITIGTEEWCSSMAWSTFKAIQIAHRAISDWV